MVLHVDDAVQPRTEMSLNQRFPRTFISLAETTRNELDRIPLESRPSRIDESTATTDSAYVEQRRTNRAVTAMRKLRKLILRPLRFFWAIHRFAVHSAYPLIELKVKRKIQHWYWGSILAAVFPLSELLWDLGWTFMPRCCRGYGNKRRQDKASKRDKSELTHIPADVVGSSRNMPLETQTLSHSRREEFNLEGHPYREHRKFKKTSEARRRELKRSMPLDLLAGTFEGVMSVPQGMSYALLATLPAEIGLYNSMIYPLLYTAFGSAIHLAVGVSAIEDLLVAESIQRLLGIECSDEERVNCAMSLAMVMGATFLLMCMFRLGVVSSFIPDPVLNGFSTASAFIIIISQLKHIVGFAVPQNLSMFGVIRFIGSNITEVNYMVVGVAACTVAFLFLTKHINRTCNAFSKFPIPGPLIVVVVFITATWYFSLNTAWNMKVISAIPSGFPSFSTPHIQWKNLYINSAETKDVTTSRSKEHTELLNIPKINELLRESLMLCSLFFVIHISLAKMVGSKKGYQVNANRELYACGMLNFFGSFLSCFPNAASLSRTCVISVVGGSTILHNLWCGVLVMLTLLLLTPLLAHLPLAVLGCIVVFGVSGMVDFSEAKRLFYLQKSVLFACRSDSSANNALSMALPDFIIWLSAFVCTLVLGATKGIIIAVLVSLFYLLRTMARPKTAVLGKLPGTYIFRSKQRFNEAVEFPRIKIFRFDSSLHYPSAIFFEKQVMDILDELAGKEPYAGLPNIVPRQLASAPRKPKDAPAQQTPSTWDTRAELSPCVVTSVTRSAEHETAEENKENSPDNNYPRTPKTSVPIRTAKDFKETDLDPTSLLPVLIIDAASVNDIDVTSITMLERVARLCQERNVLLIFANWKGIMRDFLECSKFYDYIRAETCFLSIYDAVVYAQQYQSGVVIPCVEMMSNKATTWAPVLTLGHESSQVLRPNDPATPGSNLIGHEERIVMMKNASMMEMVTNHQQMALEWDGLSSIAPGFRMIQESDRGVLWPVLNTTDM